MIKRVSINLTDQCYPKLAKAKENGWRLVEIFRVGLELCSTSECPRLTQQKGEEANEKPVEANQGPEIPII